MPDACRSPETLRCAKTTALLDLGDLSAAREMLASVHGLATNPRTHEWMRWRYTTHVLGSLAQYWVDAGDPRQARDRAGQCLTIASGKAPWKYVPMAKRLLGVIAMHARDSNGSLAALEEARAIARRIGRPNGIWRAEADIAVLMEARSDAQAAAHHRDRARSILESVRGAISDPEPAGVFAGAGEARRLLAG